MQGAPNWASLATFLLEFRELHLRLVQFSCQELKPQQQTSQIIS